MNEGRGEFWSKYREKVIVYEYNRVIVSIYLRRCDLRGYFLCRASVETVRRRGVAARLWQEGDCKQLQNVDNLQTPERDWVRNQGL